jgi:hypothetical protein
VKLKLCRLSMSLSEGRFLVIRACVFALLKIIELSKLVNCGDGRDGLRQEVSLAIA